MSAVRAIRNGAVPIRIKSDANRSFYYVYFLRRSDGLIKIGCSQGLAARFTYLRFDWPGKRFSIIGTVPTLHKDSEKIFHWMLHKYRHPRRLELFDCDQEVAFEAIAKWLKSEPRLRRSYYKSRNRKKTA